MKRLLLSVLFVLVTSICYSQNFVAVKASSANADSTTTFTYQIDNDKHKVYKSKKGAFYIWKISKKTNKKYKYYLPKEIQIKMGRKY